MSEYAGRYAELYDLFYSDKPYADEVAFVHGCFQQFGLAPIRKILELACGTGRHALELDKSGYQITAMDRSPYMIEIARRRASEHNSKIVFAAGDMQQLPLAEKEFDAAICLFDSIGYLRTDKALTEAFTAIWNHLRPNGLFIFEFWHASAMLSHYSPVRVRHWRTSKSKIVRISETTLDHKNRLANVDYTVYELNDDASYSTFRETHANRFFSVDEMQSLISAARFEPVKFFAGFNKTEPINDDIWHILAVARKASAP